MTVSRRSFLGGLLAAAACSNDAGRGSDGSGSTTEPSSTSTVTTAAVPDDLPADPFTLGIASGDPDETSVALWTRLHPAPRGDHPTAWEVATDDTFTTVIAAGVVTAGDQYGHSVHAVATGLRPGQSYRYRFRAGRFTSPTGTTRTTPTGSPSELTLAVACCQHWQDGYWTAYPHLVADAPDLVVWVGDFIYETPPEPGALRVHDAPEPLDAEGYRRRYQQYLSDPGLRAARAAVPWIVTWDDHELSNDYVASARNDGQDVAAFERRRAAAYQAWWEHQPVRVGPPAGAALALYRELRWGDLARLEVLDTRQYRSDQACGRAPVDRCTEVDDPTRTLLGAEQQAWLLDRLRERGSAWTVLAQQVAMANLAVGRMINPDQWDGYEPQRRLVLDALERIDGTMVLSGDLHAAIAADLELDGRIVGAEFVAPSMSSDFPSRLASVLQFLPVAVPAVAYAEARRHGYLLCNVTADRWHTQVRTADSVTHPESTLSTSAEFEVDHDTPGLVR